jgi:single-strand DNA-binding protein
MNFKELVRVGKDAVIRSTPAGKLVMGFSAAFDNGWGDRKQTVWLDCSAWGDRWEKVSDYIVKGSQIVVEGNIGTREHEGKTYITLDVSDIKLCGKPADNSAARQQPAHTQNAAQTTNEFDSEIPF